MAKIIVKAPFYKPGHTTESGQSRGGYAQYIGTREGVEILRSGMAGYIGERRGSHGLFSDEGLDVTLSKISEEIDNHPGNVWGFIVSLKREDAERVGYNSAEQWVNLLRSRRNVIAKEMGITPSNLRWVAAYHNKETNPHVHMMVWSSRPGEPYLSREGIHNIKQTLASDIFRQEHLQIYKKQTEARDDIKTSCRNRIEARIIIGHKNDGTPMYKSVFAKTQKSALKQLHKLIDLYRDVDLTEDCRMTLGEWLDKWLDEYMMFSLRESTIEVYRCMTEHQIKRFIGNKQLTSLTTADVQRFYNKVKKEGRAKPHPISGYELSNTMVRKVHMLLHQALEVAVKERLIVRNPTNGTTIPKKTTTEKQVLDDNQLERFMEAIKEEPYWNDFFYVEVMTGLRRGEICGIKWSDINFTEGTLLQQ